MDRQRALAVLLVGGELVAAAYLGVLIWLFAVWMLDESTAIRMGPAGWYVEAARRLAMTTVTSLGFGALCRVANRRWAAALVPSQPKAAQRIGVALGAALAVVGLVGAVRFVVVKPFM